jgi:hypothetical protein
MNEQANEVSENVDRQVRAKALYEAAQIVHDCAAQGLGLEAAQRALLREAETS